MSGLPDLKLYVSGLTLTPWANIPKLKSPSQGDFFFILSLRMRIRLNIPLPETIILLLLRFLFSLRSAFSVIFLYLVGSVRIGRTFLVSKTSILPLDDKPFCLYAFAVYLYSHTELGYNLSRQCFSGITERPTYTSLFDSRFSPCDS